MDKFNPFNFSDRIGRLQYFGFAVIWVIIIVIVVGLIGSGIDPYGQVGAGGASALFLLMLVHAIATLSYGVRRLHDFDKSGWWYLLTFVPFANFVMAPVLLLAPGTPGANRFGVR